MRAEIRGKEKEKRVRQRGQVKRMGAEKGKVQYPDMCDKKDKTDYVKDEQNRNK